MYKYTFFVVNFLLFQSLQGAQGYTIVTNDNENIPKHSKHERLPKLELPNYTKIPISNAQTDASVNDAGIRQNWDYATKLSLHISPLPPDLSTVTQNTTDSTIEFNPFEGWCVSELDRWYSKTQSIKCPFFRRRFSDCLDVIENWMKYTIIRRECWSLMGPPQAHRPAGFNMKRNEIKYKCLCPMELRNYIINDWKVDTEKGYYITGKLTTAIYRDDCLFLGPDPDLPISGLRKYVGVATHLFDYKESSSKLESLEIMHQHKRSNEYTIEKEEEVKITSIALVARWKLRGTLRLPWRPTLPTLSGQTVYHIDEEGLIACHEESWDCSVFKAFCYTFLPKFANRIWRNDDEDNNEEKRMIRSNNL